MTITALLLLLSAGWFNPAAAATSPCGTINASVAASQQVQIPFNIGGCSTLGWTGIDTFPTKGSILGDTTSGSHDGYITYSSTGSTAATDTFIARDQNGDLMTFNVTITAPAPPVAGPVNLPVAYNSTLNAATLALSGGPATSVAVQSQPSHGATLVSGTTIRYTPNIGYNGPDSFTYTATNAGGTSSPATVSVTMTAPTITVLPSSAALNGSVYVPFSQTFSATGGSAPYTYLLAGASLPTGLSFNFATGVLSGTPLQSGSYTFTVIPTDSSTGSPVNGARNYVLTLNAPTITITIPNVNLDRGVATSLQVSAAGGVGPYTYAIQSGALPAGLSLSASTGVISGTPTAAGGYSYTLVATDSNGFSGTQAISGGVGAGPPIASLSAATATYNTGTISSTINALITGGGTATSLTVTAGPSHGTVVVLSATSFIYTPTVGYAGPDLFTYTANNAAGSSSAASVSITVSLPLVNLSPSGPVLTAALLGIPYSQVFTGSGGVSTYTYSVISGTLPNGLTLVGGTLSGTPTQSGRFNFTIKVVDSSTGTGAPFSTSNAYTLAVGVPTLSISPSSLSTPQVGIAFSQQLSATGGTSPYTYAVTAGSTPAGLSLSRTGLISGTPTAAGTYSFLVTATDSANISATINYSGTVGAGRPVTANSSAVVGYNSSGNAIPTSTSGGTPTSLSITTAAGHGTVTVSSATGFFYTPTAGYSGTDTFSYTASNAAGTSAVATVTVTIGAPVVVITPSTTWSATVGVSYTQTLTWSGGNAPYSAITISSVPGGLPAGLTYSTSSTGATISGTPTQSGSFSISASATDSSTPTPVTKTQVFTLTVVPGAPVAANQSLSIAAGATATVDLVSGASGGPFTGATVGAVNPAAAGAATINNAGGQSYRLSFTPAATFSGVVTVAYTLSNASGASAAATVTITVGARTNAATDTQVKGLVAAHGQTASRFATAQLGNFSHRLESLHGDGWARSSFGLGFAQAAAPTKPLLAQWNADEVDRVVGAPLQAGMRKVSLPLLSQASPAGKQAAVTDDKGQPALPDLPSGTDQVRQELSLWIAGTIDFGQRNASGQQEGFRFTTNGISMGADYRLSDQLSVGVGTGYSRDRSDIGENGSKSIGQGVVAMLYGSFRPTPNIFIDGLLGYGTLDFDATRYVTTDGSFAAGQRSGSQVFIALSSGYEFHGDSWMWSPYGKLDLTTTTLGQYTEAATGNNALTYFKQRVSTSSATLGLRTEGRYLSRVGMWTPRGRIEYRRQFSGAGEAGISYADLASSGPAYVIRSDDSFTGNWTAGIGTRLLLAGGASLMIDYSSNLNVGQGRYSSILFGINVPLR